MAEISTLVLMSMALTSLGGGTRPCTEVSRKRVPSPLTSRARTHAPACLTQSPRSAKGRLSEHRDPVARRTPGSEERVRCSAAAPARM